MLMEGEEQRVRSTNRRRGEELARSSSFFFGKFGGWKEWRRLPKRGRGEI